MGDLEPGNQLQALLDSVRTLEAADIRVALIGGLAVGVRASVPRATIDIDLATMSIVDRAHAVATMVAAGFEHRGSHRHSENFLHPSGAPVQLAFDGNLDIAVERAERIAVAGTMLRVVRTDDLIAMKLRSGNDPARRPSKALRDLADAALLAEDDPGADEGW